jgi:hypothetical protein
MPAVFVHVSDIHFGQEKDNRVAEAFLRWRMCWEACGTPCYLFAAMRKDPFGLVGWLAASAPVCPPGWTWKTEQWISDHLLGPTCLASFDDLLDIAIQNLTRGRIEWPCHQWQARFILGDHRSGHLALPDQNL